MPARITDSHRTCKDCGETYPFTEAYFYPWGKPRKDGTFGLRTHCKKCWVKNVNPNSAKDAYVRRVFGFDTRNKYEEYVKSRGENCEVCGIPISVGVKKPKERACLDHNHITGELRGILCSNCNTALGLVAENTEVLRQMILYLEKWEHGCTQD